MQSGTCGENLTWTLDDNGTLTISGTGDMENFDFAPWYYERKSIKEVIIEDGVTTISNKAFIKCRSLTSVTIGDSVTTIDNTAFSFCTNLTDMTIPYSVTTIGDGAFEGCKNLREIHFPAGRDFEKNLSEGNNAKLSPYLKF